MSRPQSSSQHTRHGSAPPILPALAVRALNTIGDETGSAMVSNLQGCSETVRDNEVGIKLSLLFSVKEKYFCLVSVERVEREQSNAFYSEPSA